MAPFFSIILPVYNVEKYVERCVKSILAQSFSDYEIILVDDGSTDSSGEKCDMLSRQHAAISTIHKENGGLASARNAGIDRARGTYLWFVDSDDWIEPGALEKLHAPAAAEAPDMIKFDYIRVEDTAQVIHSNAQPGIYRNKALEKLRNQAFLTGGKYVLSACTHIYRREFIVKNQLSFVSERLVGSEDYLFNLEALAKVQCICVISDTLYNYEQRMGSLTQRYKKNLPQRYGELYSRLRERYEALGVLAQYESGISAFYVWHLLRGTCIPNAYYTTEEHSLCAGRKEIRAFLSSETFRQAYRFLDKKRFSRKKRLHLQAMKWKFEPLFYWLYVRKPRLKKGKIHENKAEIA